jgi:hypothetical protein
MPREDEDAPVLSDEEVRETLHAEWGAIVPEAFNTAAEAWLREKWGEPAECPMCGTNTWEIGRRLVALTTWGTESVTPVLPVTCGNCGNMLHVDAEKAGLVKPDDDTNDG